MLIASLLLVGASVAFAPVNPQRVSEIAAMLPAKPALVDPDDRIKDTKADVKKASKLAKEDVPAFAHELYREFVVNGNRTRFQSWRGSFLFDLTQLVAAEAAERRGRFVPAIAARLDALCAWPSWVLPAHDVKRDIVEGREMRIDLVSSSLARQLALVLHYVGDALPAPCVARVRAEIDRRVFRPYLDHPDKEWWFQGKNNWNAVCHAGCVIAALEIIEDPVTRARFVEGAERGSAVFMKYGFEADGYCTEGMSYWNYGFGHFLDLGIAVRRATGGKVDYFSHPRAIKAMRYAADYQLERGLSPKFADGAGDASKVAVERGLSVWPELRSAFEDALPLRSAFPDGQVWVMRLPAGDPAHFALGFKGGYNDEHHNHNDIGSYCVMIDGKIVSGDVGGEVYTARTFSPHRYDSKVINSYGHPVPRVGGTLQPTGRKFAAKVLKTDFTETRDTVVLDLVGAYACPSLKKLERTFVFDRVARTATITDSVAFTQPTAFESPYMTVEPDALRGHVSVSATGGAWERTEESFENPNRPTPHRTAVRFKEPVTDATVSFVFSAGVSAVE